MRKRGCTRGVAVFLFFALASTACGKDGRGRGDEDTFDTDTEDTNDTGSGTDLDTDVSLSGLTVGNAAVRACDVLLEERETQIVGVEFAQAVRGESGRMSPRFAFAFSATRDEGFEGTVAKLKLRGEDASGFSKLEVSCFDRAGQKVAAPDVRLDGQALVGNL